MFYGGELLIRLQNSFIIFSRKGMSRAYFKIRNCRFFFARRGCAVRHDFPLIGRKGSVPVDLLVQRDNKNHCKEPRYRGKHIFVLLFQEGCTCTVIKLNSCRAGRVHGAISFVDTLENCRISVLYASNHYFSLKIKCFIKCKPVRILIGADKFKIFKWTEAF